MRKLSLLIGSIAVVALLSGCASDVWVKGGVSREQATADLKSCSEEAGLLFQASDEASVQGAVSQGLPSQRETFEKCMTGKGYRMEKMEK